MRMKCSEASNNRLNNTGGNKKNKRRSHGSPFLYRKFSNYMCSARLPVASKAASLKLSVKVG